MWLSIADLRAHRGTRNKIRGGKIVELCMFEFIHSVCVMGCVVLFGCSLAALLFRYL
jgi:hypothetical protein